MSVFHIPLSFFKVGVPTELQLTWKVVSNVKFLFPLEFQEGGGKSDLQ